MAKTVPNATAKPPSRGKANLVALLFCDELAVVDEGWEVGVGAHGTGTPLY